jgi:phosphohistidine phosphatase
MSRRIVALRHGKPLSEGYAEDGLRPLSDEGREITARTLFSLKERGYIPTQILSSPLLRALQTAEVVADAFDLSVDVELGLGPDFDREQLLATIASMDDGGVLYLVGHAPTLADFVTELVGEQVLPAGLGKSCAATAMFNEEVTWGTAQFLELITPLV